MTWRPPMLLSRAHKLALAVAACTVLAAPLVIGILRGQTLPPAPQYKFEVASIRRSNAIDNNNRLGPGPQGGLAAQNVLPMQLVAFAYGVRPFQIVGGPGWAHSDRYDIRATPDKPEPQPSALDSREKIEEYRDRIRQRVQALLAERFGLVLRVEKREMPVYSLVVRKGGHKLTPSSPEKTQNMSTSNRRMTGTAVRMKEVAFALAGVLHQPVIDDTGLDGIFDLAMEWTPDVQAAEAAGEPAGASIFTAIQEQLGLKLETKRAPMPVFVVEKLERPTEN